MGNVYGILYKDKWFDSKRADWKIDKIDERKARVNLKWNNPAVSQDWHIYLESDNSIKWDVYMKADGDLKIGQSQTGILLSDEYKRWVYSEKKGEFTDITPSDKYWQEVVLKDSSSRFAAVDKVTKPGEVLPAVVLDITGSAKDSFTLIENTNNQMNARALRSLTTNITNINTECLLSSVKINIDSEGAIVQDYLEKHTHKRCINKEPLKLIFNEGKIRLFYNEVEITKNLGLYTSIRSSGIWHDSTRAKWELEKIDETKVRAHLKWLKLPIEQIWKIEISGEEEINCDIRMEISGKLRIEREQTNIMLTDNYLTWLVSNGVRGKFPKEFNEDYGGDWQSLWKGSCRDGLIGVSVPKRREYSLPIVTLECRPSQDDEDIVSIVNSDKLFQGRVLQCLRPVLAKNRELLPSQYNYFSGKIKIDNSKNGL